MWPLCWSPSLNNWLVTPATWHTTKFSEVKELTLMSRAKQRWRFMSLLRSLGRLRIKFSSSTPLVSCHLYCSYLLIRSLRSSGSNRCDIHCSASRLLTLISSNLVVVDCKYVWFKTSWICQKMKYMGLKQVNFIVNTIKLKQPKSVLNLASQTTQ